MRGFEPRGAMARATRSQSSPGQSAATRAAPLQPHRFGCSAAALLSRSAQVIAAAGFVGKRCLRACAYRGHIVACSEGGCSVWHIETSSASSWAVEIPQASPRSRKPSFEIFEIGTLSHVGRISLGRSRKLWRSRSLGRTSHAKFLSQRVCPTLPLVPRTMRGHPPRARKHV